MKRQNALTTLLLSVADVTGQLPAPTPVYVALTLSSAFMRRIRFLQRLCCRYALHTIRVRDIPALWDRAFEHQITATESTVTAAEIEFVAVNTGGRHVFTSASIELTTLEHMSVTGSLLEFHDDVDWHLAVAEPFALAVLQRLAEDRQRESEPPLFVKTSAEGGADHE